MLNRFILSLGLLVMVLAAVPTGAQEKKRFAAEDSLNLQVLSFSLGGISPDSAWAAYAVTDHYHERTNTTLDWVVYSANTHVWIKSLRGPESFQITTGDVFSWGPVWSPDGNSLAMYIWKDNAIAVGIWNREDHNLRVLTGTPARGFNQ